MRILVIEDNTKHLADAKTFFAKEHKHPEVEVLYAQTLVEASETVDCLGGRDPGKEKVDGIISDVFFPLSAWRPQVEPVGVGVLLLCREYGVPCVLNTAGH